MTRCYRYVGPRAIRERAASQPAGAPIHCPQDVMVWMTSTGQQVRRGESIAATFVVTRDRTLRIADRHSEHVACAGGGEVLSAGEIFFSFDRSGVRAESVSNQSTGYCPEPESWPAVADALDLAGVAHPGEFTTVCTFRRCDACGERNLVKDDWFYCAVCGATLSKAWNFD